MCRVQPCQFCWKAESLIVLTGEAFERAWGCFIVSASKISNCTGKCQNNPDTCVSPAAWLSRWFTSHSLVFTWNLPEHFLTLCQTFGKLPAVLNGFRLLHRIEVIKSQASIESQVSITEWFLDEEDLWRHISNANKWRTLNCSPHLQSHFLKAALCCPLQNQAETFWHWVLLTLLPSACIYKKGQSTLTPTSSWKTWTEENSGTPHALGHLLQLLHPRIILLSLWHHFFALK